MKNGMVGILVIVTLFVPLQAFADMLDFGFTGSVFTGGTCMVTGCEPIGFDGVGNGSRIVGSFGYDRVPGISSSDNAYFSATVGSQTLSGRGSIGYTGIAPGTHFVLLLADSAELFLRVPIAQESALGCNPNSFICNSLPTSFEGFSVDRILEFRQGHFGFIDPIDGHEAGDTMYLNATVDSVTAMHPATNPIPEPATWMLLASGLALIGWKRVKK